MQRGRAYLQCLELEQKRIQVFECELPLYLELVIKRYVRHNYKITARHRERETQTYIISINIHGEIKRN
ncbi:hypothetical protein QVD17_08313 [Tagetes erecta]|uniref:Uncharacterized protein n=1 Tax=Tagetes erecta TaxID=13708 RepID=A0AAD8KXX8_TARER|nr:hypothetical protein QVD17_08313 [Tagetes erecta]